MAVVFTMTTAWLAGSSDGPRLFYASDTRAAALLIGCIVALAMASGWRPHRTKAGAAMAAAYLGVFALVGNVDPPPWLMFRGGLLLADVAAAVIVVHVVAHPGLLSQRWLVAVGRRSYGLYLWHWPIYVLAPLPIGLCVPLAFAAAWLSYRFVEQPFLRVARRRSPAPPAA
jgi:peptidoglycan/LPS O-acetylase OafA/YrhL